MSNEKNLQEIHLAVARWCGWTVDVVPGSNPQSPDSRNITDPDGNPAYSVPNYLSHDTFVSVVNEIERRGLMQRYLEELCREVNKTTEPTTWGEVAALMTATPAQRLAAAAKVIEEEKSNGQHD